MSSISNFNPNSANNFLSSSLYLVLAKYSVSAKQVRAINNFSYSENSYIFLNKS